ncbi:uncharacterized protein LDX57_002501 [Aspergillus melleus]|uniref:uncharacterized protein n=1 Tax=Aspergillus melleus TaxID=138277 RepID=UPI001E8D87BC|nr:uncharacterized protein LDX57_002501 [Aspergillus melleus]KAH8424758.1 hypothetical protein LDX57_002501 [Aspergillus melleus]
MPPLSAYTPFESLLFFQSLAALDARPANFVSISNGLCNNRFVRENVAFDAGRLAPEALEDLYSTLTREGTDAVASIPHEPNGRHDESPSAHNSKKRKISSPKPDGLAEKGIIGQAGIVPEIVSHLYARYRDLVTKEIRNEERKYNEIRSELERLKEEREAVPEPAPTPATAEKPTSETPAATQYPVPEPMDVDTPSEKSTQQPRPDVAQSSVAPKPGPEIKEPPLEPPRKEVEASKQPTPITPRPPAPQKQQKPLQPMPASSPAPSVKQSPKEPPTKTPTQPLPLKPYQPQPPLQPQAIAQASSAPPFQVQAPNGQPPSVSQPPNLVPRDLPTPKGPTNKASLPPQLPSQPPSQPPVDVAQSPSATAVQPSPIAKPPAPSPASAKTPQTAKTTAQEVSSTPAPKTTQPPPLQPTIQQWSLNQPPQTPSVPPSQKLEPMGQAPAAKPLPSPSSQQTPKPQPKKVEPKKAPKATQPATVPSTPLPVSTVPKPLGPSSYGAGYETPNTAPHALLQSQPRSSLPRLSIDTSGSVTPWKKTPRLTLPHSPRSPDRPRPEDVSPISEKAPSLMGSREATPEEPDPPRRKRRAEAKGSSRGREPSPPAGEADHKGGPRSKSDRSTFSVNKRRDQSTASSRSRGRSVLSREDEPAVDPPGKIKREMPTTPAGVPDVAETEHRASGGRKSVAAAAASEEQRPGRGRPKRKRPPSESFDTEPPQPEISQLSRIDPNQSTPFVLAARNFPKTGQAIMNNVTTHKHASVFSKPLTERDAPGYRDLIYRPQDLKSIKSSITQGSKALVAATEAANTPVADGESPIPSGTPSKNSVLMLQKSEDVIPPKGIVNSAQLEKELIRMFSNATMFNPIPQRGFGPAFPMIADGESRESTIVPEPDEGGIIKATHEMFEDVEKAVTGWRQAERTSDELASKSILSLRRGSASDLNTDSADEVKGS